MAALYTWPDLSGDEGTPEIEISGGETVVFESQARTKWALSTAPGKRRFVYRYSGLRTNKAAPAPYGAYSEAAVVEHLVINVLRGRLNTVNVKHPRTGELIECRLESDTVKLKKAHRHAHWYQAEIAFIEE